MPKPTHRRAAEILRNDGFREFIKEARGFTRRSFGGMLSCSGYLGTNVFTKEWDVLILLDTCRLDAIRRLAHEYEFITSIDSIYSVGATSAEWMAATFTRQYLNEIRSTAYISGNAFAYKVFDETSGYKLPEPFICDWEIVDESDFGRLEHIWRYNENEGGRGPGHTKGGIPAEYITDRGVAVQRNHDYERLILHYIQPHSPYTSAALEEDRELKRYEEEPFEYLEDGGDREKVYECYINELRAVLDEIELLLNNLDAERVVISADHGELFGEYGAYAHPFGSLNPSVRKVPWVSTSATDTKTYEPKFEPIGQADREVDDFLEAMGYV